MNTKIKVIFLFLFFSFYAVCSHAEELPTTPVGTTSGLMPSALPVSRVIPENPHIKILILKESDRFNLAIPFSYTVQIAPHLQVIEQHEPLPSVPVIVGPKGIQIGSTIYASSHVKLITNHKYFTINGREYRDDLHIILSNEGKINLINDVNLEDYLKGVLPWEVSEGWPIETLKAQAVTARTYAYFKMLERSGQVHILTSDVLGQVYVGKTAEKSKTTQAVNETYGEMLVAGSGDRLNIFPTFFHANCGGETTKADSVWRIAPNPILKGVTCGFCKGTKHEFWHAKISLTQIESKIHERGYTISPIKNIVFSDYDSTGRAQKITLIHRKGALVLDANDFRLFIGPNIVRSTKAAVRVENGQAYFKGKGWGHGVGFCQWGAKGQAESGKKYYQILSFYFPGSRIEKLYGVKAKDLTQKPESAQKEEDLFDKMDRTMNNWFG